MTFRRYRGAIFLFPFALGIYFVLGTVPWTFHPDRLVLRGAEIFPFFSWSLFSMPRRVVTRYTLVLTDVESSGKAFLGAGDPPIWIQNTRIQRDISFSKVMWGFGSAYEQREQDPARFERMKTLAENYLRPYGVLRYELVKRRMNPVDYYLHQKTEDERTLESFTLGTHK